MPLSTLHHSVKITPINHGLGCTLMVCHRHSSEWVSWNGYQVTRRTYANRAVTTGYQCINYRSEVAALIHAANIISTNVDHITHDDVVFMTVNKLPQLEKALQGMMYQTCAAMDPLPLWHPWQSSVPKTNNNIPKLNLGICTEHHKNWMFTTICQIQSM